MKNQVLDFPLNFHPSFDRKHWILQVRHMGGAVKGSECSGRKEAYSQGGSPGWDRWQQPQLPDQGITCCLETAGGRRWPAAPPVCWSPKDLAVMETTGRKRAVLSQLVGVAAWVGERGGGDAPFLSFFFYFNSKIETLFLFIWKFQIVLSNIVSRSKLFFSYSNNTLSINFKKLIKLKRCSCGSAECFHGSLT